MELNAHSLGSKFFGESGKIVSKTFEGIELLLEAEEDTFVYVFVDEVETLAARRERALAGNEPFDAVRAVNALLTGLDRLKKYDNVIVICTSNLVTALVSILEGRPRVCEYRPDPASRAGPSLSRSGRHQAIYSTPVRSIHLWDLQRVSAGAESPRDHRRDVV